MGRDDLTGTVDDDVIFTVVEQLQLRIEKIENTSTLMAANERLLVQV